MGYTVTLQRRSGVGFLPLPQPSGSVLLSPEVTEGRKVPPAFTIALPWHPQVEMVAASAPEGTGPSPCLAGEAGQVLSEPALRGLEWSRGPRAEHSGRGERERLGSCFGEVLLSGGSCL